MKKITNKTILKQVDKTYQPIEVDDVIYWIDKNITTKELLENPQTFVYRRDGKIQKHKEQREGFFCDAIVVQSSPILEGVPVISLDEYVKKLAIDCANLNKSNFDNWYGCHDGFISGYKSNPKQYSLKDIEEAIKLAMTWNLSKEKILEQINSISIINVDEQFNIISYE